MVALESDLREFYHRDLVDLWRPNTGVTVRWVISRIESLMGRKESQLFRHLAGDSGIWGYEEHLLADIRDISASSRYLTLQLVAANFKQTDLDKILQGQPTPPLRPGDEPEEIKFATKDELLQLFNGGGKPRGRHK